MWWMSSMAVSSQAILPGKQDCRPCKAIWFGIKRKALAAGVVEVAVAGAGGLTSYNKLQGVLRDGHKSIDIWQWGNLSICVAGFGDC